MTSKKQPSGGARARAAGKVQKLILWPPEQAALIDQAAVVEDRDFSSFCRYHAVEAAKRILKAHEKTPANAGAK
jgi:uncharacterized protein (DUF1778 family)